MAGEREKGLLVVSFIHELVDSYICSERGSNRQPWPIRRLL